MTVSHFLDPFHSGTAISIFIAALTRLCHSTTYCEGKAQRALGPAFTTSTKRRAYTTAQAVVQSYTSARRIDGS